jgi:effector-binding domain-containing protein
MNFRKIFGLLFATVLMALSTEQLMAVEEAVYTVIRQDGDIEIREYAEAIVAETVVVDDFEDAGNRAFRKLFNYIGGANQSQGKIAMTAPVTQEKRSEKIAMTSPVGQQKSGDGWAVSFMMPASYSMESIPQPTDPAIIIRQVPAHRVAAIRYSGFWSEEKYQEHLEELQTWIENKNQVVSGQPVWARYNAPFTPWFMRRNEILIPVK